MPLVPRDSIAGRALVTVIAIMTFLAALTAGVAMLVADASHDWQNDVSQEMTIQVRPTPGHDLDAETNEAADLARAAPGIRTVDPYSKGESEKLLQPWLGTDLDLGDLPVPRLIVVKLDPTTRRSTSPRCAGRWPTRCPASASTITASGWRGSRPWHMRRWRSASSYSRSC